MNVWSLGDEAGLGGGAEHLAWVLEVGSGLFLLCALVAALVAALGRGRGRAVGYGVGMLVCAATSLLGAHVLGGEVAGALVRLMLTQPLAVGVGVAAVALRAAGDVGTPSARAASSERLRRRSLEAPSQGHGMQDVSRHAISSMRSGRRSRGDQPMRASRARTHDLWSGQAGG
jgi:hypothetical protein